MRDDRCWYRRRVESGSHPRRCPLSAAQSWIADHVGMVAMRGRGATVLVNLESVMADAIGPGTGESGLSRRVGRGTRAVLAARAERRTDDRNVLCMGVGRVDMGILTSSDQ